MRRIGMLFICRRGDGACLGKPDLEVPPQGLIWIDLFIQRDHFSPHGVYR